MGENKAATYIVMKKCVEERRNVSNYKQIVFIVVATGVLLYGCYGIIKYFEKPLHLTSVDELPSHKNKKVSLSVSYLENTGIGEEVSYFGMIKNSKYYHLAVTEGEAFLFYSEDDPRESGRITGYVTTSQYRDIKEQLIEYDPLFDEFEFYPYNVTVKYDWMFENIFYIMVSLLGLVYEIRRMIQYGIG